MTPVERIAVEAIALLPGVPDEAKRLLLSLAMGRSSSSGPTPEGEVNPATRRWRRWQEKRRGANAEPTLPNVGANALANASANAPPPPDPPETLSEIVDLSPSERESETRMRAAPNAGTNATANALANAPPPSAVRSLELTEPLTDELREIARFPGCEVQDVESAWRKFLGTRVAKGLIHVAGEWQAYCTSWAKNERAERDKRHREEAAAAPKHDSPAVREERKRREQAHREAEAKAAPPPPEAYALAGIRKARAG